MSDEYASVDVLEREGRNLLSDATPTHAKTYGRAMEVEALARALAGRKSAVLLGSPGVGKTAVIKKLLHYVRTRRIEALAQASVYEISTAGLCSGTRYTGQQEEKIASLLKHARPDRLVYIPDLWNITRAGSYETNPRGIYDLMRPGIEADNLILFGEMSVGRWEKLCREFPVLERDFATITVSATNEEETREILFKVASSLGPTNLFEREAIERVHSLARKFLPTQSFPGKGVDLLRRVANDRAMLPAEKRARPIDAEHVESQFARQTGLPLHMISPRVSVSYDDMRGFLETRVLGQSEAVTAVADLLALYKTGLSNPDRPAGVLLFVGPTGVGKTELAKATAEFLFGGRDRIFRVDLSEYKDYHSFEKLIGNPKADTTGLLTDHVRQNPFTVVLLDEFEKGHPNIADLFLQVFDDGRLTDAQGETVGFHHALIILTSNLGSDVAALESSIGFSGEPKVSDKRIDQAIRRALEQHHRPEFLNRIDRILSLKPLRHEDLKRIARRELGKVYKREGFIERDLLLEVDDGVIDLLLERGIDPKYGARPLKRAIEELLVIPLARSLLSHDWRRFQLLRVARKGGGVEISFEETEVSKKLENLERRARVSDGDGNTITLALSDVRGGLGDAYERLSRLGQAAGLEAMQRELREIATRESTPAFWEDALGRAGTLVRQHRLTMEVRRLEALREELDLVRELCEASFAEGNDAVASDLGHSYARLLRRLVRAERELVSFSEVDQGDALVVVTPAGSRDGASGWARDLADMYFAWAKERGYDVDVDETPEGVFRVRVLGSYALGYLKGEHGSHRLILPPEGKGERRGDTFLARVELSPLGGASLEAESSQRGRDEPPIRTYDLWRSRGVRDRRTGYVDGDVRRVLGGKLDAFLEAYLDLAPRRVAGPSPELSESLD